MFTPILKKGQLQIQETILVIFVFIIILIIGMAFFLRYQKEGIKQDNENYLREKFNLMLKTFPESPEVKCSILGEKENCLDTLKLTSFSMLNTEQFKELGFKNITVYTAYPNPNPKLCTSKTQNDCGVWNVYTKKPANYEHLNKITTPISLYNPETKTYSIGILILEAYI